ncbi:O-antigen ligase family protein [Rubrivivax albus]|nr:O-antigen ligase family protein [Rubrivivax albus]
MYRYVSPMALGAAVAYVLTVPVVLVGIGGWSGYDLARLLQWPVLLLATLASALSATPARTGSGLPGGLWLAIAAIGALAVALSPVPSMALREAALIGGLLALAGLVSRAGDWLEALLRVVLVAAGGYALLIAGLAITVTLAGDTVSRRDLFVGYDNHRFYSHVLTVAIPLALAARLTLTGRAWRRGADATLALLGLMLFATGGRGSMVALAGGTALVLIRLGRAAFWPAVRPLVLGLAVGLAGFVLLFVWAPANDPASSAALADYSASRLASDQARLPLWRHAVDMALASPWFGAGPMHFAQGPNAIAAHPHSLPLQIAAEWGLPMLVLVGLVIALVLRRIWQRLGTADGASGLGIALSIGAVAVLLDALVSGNFVVPMSQVWIAVLLGLFWAWLHPENRGSQASAEMAGRRWLSPGRLAAVVALLLQLWLGTQMLPEAARIGEHIKDARAAFPTERYQPRFWSHGRF